MKSTDFISVMPEGWQKKRLKFISSYVVSNVDKHSNENEVPIRLCNYTDVYNNERINTKLSFMRATATHTEIEKFRLRIGDVLITKDSESWNDIGVPAYVEEEADDLVCGYHLSLIRPNAIDIDGRFLFRCFQARPVALQLELEASGITRYGLSIDTIGCLALPIPSLALQQTIADYLDRETARIDSLIAEKQRMLELLEEKRSAMISHVVTKGLNPDVIMKDSGIDWLGEIPEHWEKTHFKYVCDLNPNVDLSEMQDEEEATFLPMEKIKNGYFIENVAPISKYNPSYNAFVEGDLVLAKVTPCFENGNIAIAENLNNQVGFGTSEIFVIRPIQVDGRFVFYYLQSRYFKQQGEASMTGAGGLKRVSPDFVRGHIIGLPPRNEQITIAEYLTIQISRMESTAANVNETIQLLKERRAALISAAVTGKIDVEEMDT